MEIINVPFIIRPTDSIFIERQEKITTGLPRDMVIEFITSLKKHIRDEGYINESYDEYPVLDIETDSTGWPIYAKVVIDNHKLEKNRLFMGFGYYCKGDDIIEFINDIQLSYLPDDCFSIFNECDNLDEFLEDLRQFSLKRTTLSVTTAMVNSLKRFISNNRIGSKIDLFYALDNMYIRGIGNKAKQMIDNYCKVYL